MTNDENILELINKKDFVHAESKINEKLRNNPNDADAFYFLGVLNYFQGKISQGISNLKSALNADPKHTDAAICLSVLFNDIGKYDEAKKVFDIANQSVAQKNSSNALSIDKKFAVKHLELADLYFRYKRYDEAIEEYSKSISLDPLSLDIRIRRAKAYAKKGFMTRAIQELQQVKKENPNFSAARIQLGLLYYSQGNLLDAELEWEETLALKPDSKEARSYLEIAKEARSLR